MIKKLKIKFISVALVSVAVLLFVTLATINIVNFSMVAADADKILDMLVKDAGQFNFDLPDGTIPPWEQEGNGGQFGPPPTGDNSSEGDVDPQAPPEGEPQAPQQAEPQAPQQAEPQAPQEGQNPDSATGQPPEDFVPPEGDRNFPFGPGPWGMFGPMGPDSKDTQQSTRFFTIAFNDDGDSRVVNHSMSAVTEDEAVDLILKFIKK